MYTTFKAADPDAIQMELTVIMSLRDWKELQKQLKSQEHPSFTLGNEIDELVRKAEEHFYISEPVSSN